MKSRLYVVSSFLLPIALAAQIVPPLVNYQGRLSNPDGSPLATANYQLTFNVYDAASGGNLIWGPEIFDGNVGLGHGALIPVVQGYFNVMLGPTDINGAPLAGAFTASNRFIQVTVTNHPPISPSQQVLTTPFAFEAAFAASATLATNVVSGIVVSNLNLPGPEATISSGSSTILYSDGVSNFFAGSAAGNALTTGSNNTGIGFEALFRNTSGASNTATGFQALFNNRAGVNNVANGNAALRNNNNGGANTAVGAGALFNNNGASDNTATGYEALFENNDGQFNTATGYQALYSNIGGQNNTASGFQALYAGQNPQNDTVTGYQALYSSQNTLNETALGYQALYTDNNGQNDTATGAQALYANSSGRDLTATGYRALTGNTTGTENTAVGSLALAQNSTGTGNIALGFQAGQNVINNYNIDIGSPGSSSDTGTIRIGSGNQTSAYIAGIFSGVAPGGLPVYVTTTGQLGVTTSSARFKENISSMSDASDVLLSLHPVTFNYRPELDPHHLPQFGLIAEEVAKVDPALVVRDDKNQIYSVRYDAVNAMLLNEFLKEHHTVQEQKDKINDLEERLDALEKIVLGQKSK